MAFNSQHYNAQDTYEDARETPFDPHYASLHTQANPAEYSYPPVGVGARGEGAGYGPNDSDDWSAGEKPMYPVTRGSIAAQVRLLHGHAHRLVSRMNCPENI